MAKSTKHNKAKRAVGGAAGVISLGNEYNKQSAPSTPRKAGSPHIEETPKPKTESAKPKTSPKAKPKTPKMSKATAKKMVKGAGLAGAAKVAGAAAIPVAIAAATSAPALYEMKRQATPLSEKEKSRKEELSKSFKSHSKSQRAEYIKLVAREGRTAKKSETTPKEAPKAEKKIGEDVKQNGVTKPAVEAPKKEAPKSTPAKTETKKPEKKLAKNWSPELNKLVAERAKLRKEGKDTAEIQNKINEKMGSKVRHKTSAVKTALAKGDEAGKRIQKGFAEERKKRSEKEVTAGRSTISAKPESKTQKKIDERKTSEEKSSPVVQRLREQAKKTAGTKSGTATLNRRKRK